jgi:serine/threonine-protein kinase
MHLGRTVRRRLDRAARQHPGSSVNIGSNIGQYRIVRKIGAGGMGTVFVGEHILLGRRAAIKTLLPLLSMQREIVERFFTEARATSAISDPGVVQIFDFGYHVDGTAYIVMELLEGEALSARLGRLGRLSPCEALRIARQVAGALGAAHACDIVHRDLKPENVFLIRDPEAQGGERAKLLDFGICQLGIDDAGITEPGAMLGTPVYMSPEQCKGAGRVDQRADIYGLGCVVFHMLTGHAPFEDEVGAGEIIVAHLQRTAPAPSELVAELPEAIDKLVERCLAKSPDDRFQSMAELQTAIEQVLPLIDATPTPIIDSPSVALGAGFKSHYDGNLGTNVPRRDAEPPILLTNPKPTTLRAATGEVELPPPQQSGVRSLVVILLTGVAFAVVAATLARPEELAAVAPSVEAFHPDPVDAATPEPAAPPITPTVATNETNPTSAEPAVERERVERPVAAKPRAAKPPAKVKKPVAKRPVRRVVRKPAPKPVPVIEDLYETR